MKTHHKLMLMLGASMVAMPAYAADQPAEEGVGNNEIIVSARRVNESAQKVSVSLTAFSSKDIDSKVIQQASDLAKLTPSLQLAVPNTSPQGFYAQLRGQAQTTTDPNSPGGVAFYLDDIYLGGAGLAGGLLNTADIEHIETLKGPQGTLYGRNTTGGLIKFVTKKPVDRFEAYAKVGLGNYSRRLFEGMINLPVAENLAIRVDGQTQDHAGYHKNVDNNTDLDDDHRWNLRAAVKWDPTPDFHVLWQGWYGKGHMNGVDNRTTYVDPNATFAIKNIIATQGLGGLTNAQVVGLDLTTGQGAVLKQQALDLVQQYANAPYSQSHAGANPLLQQYNRAKAAGTSLTLEYDIGNMALKSITGYSYMDRDSAFDVGGGPWTPIYTQQKAYVSQWSEELQATGKAFDNKLQYAAGLYLISENIFDGRDRSGRYGTFPLFVGQLGLGAVPGVSPITNPSGSVGNNWSQVRSLAPYTQMSYEILNGLKLAGGLRYTTESFKMTTSQVQYANNGTAACNSPLPTTAGLAPADCVSTSPKSTFSNWSYMIGLDWQVAPNVLLYAKRVRGFRAGGINGYGSNGTPWSVLVYRPEVNTDHEVGIKSDFFDHRLRLNVAYYHTDYNDIQRTVTVVIAPAVPGGQPQFATAVQNAAQAKLQGVEWEASIVPLPGLTLGVNGAYTKAKYASYDVILAGYISPANPTGTVSLASEPFQGVPPWSYTLSGSYERPTGFGSVRASVDWAWRSGYNEFAHDIIPLSPTGPKAPLSALYQEAFGLLNGSLTFDVKKYDTSITIWGKNMLNKRYKETITSLVTLGLGYTWANYGAPATFGVDITKRF